jgi:hypothetical protein
MTPGPCREMGISVGLLENVFQYGPQRDAVPFIIRVELAPKGAEQILADYGAGRSGTDLDFLMDLIGRKLDDAKASLKLNHVAAR